MSTGAGIDLDLFKRGVDLEKSERAERAVKSFRALQPTLSAFARVLTGNPTIRVEMATRDNGSTDGKRIFFRPPIALGDNLEHQRRLCDKRDIEKQLLCSACAVREEVLTTIYHEIAHLCYDSFEKTTEEDQANLTAAAVKEVGGKYSEAIAARIKQAPAWTKNTYIGMANLISPFLPIVVNALEDARVNRALFEARKGTKVMFDASMYRVFTEGVEQKDENGEIIVKMWNEYPLNMQALVGIFCKASGYDYTDWFVPSIVAALGDEELTNLVNQMRTVRSAGAVYHLSFPVLNRLRELGYCKSEIDPELEEDEKEEESDDSAESDEESEQAEKDSGKDDSESDSSGDSETPTNDGEPCSSGSPSEGESPDGAPENGDEGEGEGAGEGGTSDDSDGTADDSETEVSSGGGDSEESSGSGSSDSEDSDMDETDDSGSGSGGSESDSNGSSGEATSDAKPDGDGSNSDSSESGESTPEDGETDGSFEGKGDISANTSGTSQSDPSADEPRPDAGEGDDQDSSDDNGETGSEAGDSLQPSDNSRDLSNPEDDVHSPEGGKTEGVELADGEDRKKGSDDSDLDLDAVQEASEGDGRDSDNPSETGDEDDSELIDTGADDGTGGIELIENEANDCKPLPMGTPEDCKRGLLIIGDHEEKPKSIEETVEDDAIDRALIQGIYFETPSQKIFGVREHHYGQPIMIDGYNLSKGWKGDYDNYSRRYISGGAGDFTPSEKVLGPALVRMRVAFSDNQRGKEVRGRRSGKVDARVLGKRAPHGDDRLFKKKLLPGKKDYVVVIMMDLSGSTIGKCFASII